MDAALIALIYALFGAVALTLLVVAVGVCGVEPRRLTYTYR